MTDGSLASSPMILSAGGQDEQPCEVKSSTTARGSAASAGRMTAMIAHTPSAPDHREKRLWAIIAVIPNPESYWPPFLHTAASGPPAFQRRKAAFLIGRLPRARYSLRGDASITFASRRQPAQHVVQNTAVPVVVEFVERIDPAQQWDPLQRAIARNDLRGQLLPRFQVALEAVDCHRLVALQPERLPRRPLLEGQRQHAHTDEIGAMDPLEALADHGAHAQKPRSLRGPVA